VKLNRVKNSRVFISVSRVRGASILLQAMADLLQGEF
jgi:hypothetical protein